MNHYAARQRESDKRWNYTCANKRTGTYAVGYCRGWSELTPERAHEIFGDAFQSALDEQDRRRESIDKYHDDGHATAQEAQQCYRLYLLDHRLQLDGQMLNQQRKCKVCGAYTEGFASIDVYIFDLCDEHRTRDQVEKLLPSVGDSYSSY